jgi:prepilin-type N-terminal cleavage/methylation domain-containing protein
MYRKLGARSGFTLIELMMVVAILGILAVIAVPQYKSYVYKSKTAEAVGFLAEIKARQESYRADFGMYCDASANATAWAPDADPIDRPRPWVQDADWQQLGAVAPGRQTLFSYVTVAGLPGTDTPMQHGFSSNLGYNGTDFWFISRALGDLDNDGVNVTFESYSHGQGLYIDKESGWE